MNFKHFFLSKINITKRERKSPKAKMDRPIYNKKRLRDRAMGVGPWVLFL